MHSVPHGLVWKTIFTNKVLMNKLWWIGLGSSWKILQLWKHTLNFVRLTLCLQIYLLNTIVIHLSIKNLNLPVILYYLSYSICAESWILWHNFNRLWLNCLINCRIQELATQIQYPEIKKTCGDTATVLYFRSNKRLQIENESLPRAWHLLVFPNDRAKKLQFI